MIILDAADQRSKFDPPVAGPTLRLPDRAVGRSASPLPDYETSQAQHILTTQKSVHAGADRRFWRATLYALGIYILLSVAIGVPLLVTQLHGRHGGHPPPGWHEDAVVQHMSSSEVVLSASLGCNAWEEAHDVPQQSFYSASTSHTFSPQGSLSVRSNVSHEAAEAVGVSGNITVDINPDPSVSFVSVSVSLTTSSRELRQRTHACFTDKGATRGLSLYIPSDLDYQRESLSLDINLLFPQSTSRLSFDTLATYLPMFPQSFANLGQNITFSKVSLEGAAMDISCDFIQAPIISVKNALAGISGSFNASQRLVLDTVGGPIFANITIVQGTERMGPSFFSLDTGNSEIDANVTMQVTSHPSEQVNFIGSVKNFNGPLTLNVAHDIDTPPVPLDLQVQNNQAVSNVTLDSKYVGNFDVQTKLATVHVFENPEDSTADPFGENQKRSYIYDSMSSTRIQGWAGWGKRKPLWNPHDVGRVQIVSSLSPIVLRLGPASPS